MKALILKLYHSKTVQHVIETRHTIGHKLSRPLVLMETATHTGYCYFAYAEGHGMYSLFAGLLCVVIVTTTVFGAE